MRCLCLATFVLVMTASSASAATPFRAGDGDEPAVSVATDGSGHVVWQVPGSDTKVGYCRVTAQAGACNRTESLSFPGGGTANDAGRPQVFAPSAGRVLIVATCWNCGIGGTTNRTYRWTSTDNGGSFGAPLEIGRGPMTGGFGTLLADESFVGVEGSEAKAAETTGSAPIQFTSFAVTFGSDIVRDPVAGQLVAVTNDLSTIRNGAFRGATVTTAQVNQDDADWVKDQGLIGAEGSNRGQSLAAGPRGVFMAYESTPGGDERAGLRTYNPAIWAFGPPTYVEGADAIDADPDYVDSFQDAAGRLHLAWRSLHDGGRLRYRVSDTAGNNLTAAANLAARDSFVEPELGAAGDGRGFVTWTSGSEVRVVALDPQAEAVPPGPGPPPPAPAIPPVSKAGTIYSGPNRLRVTRVPGASITFIAPRGCVAAGQRFRVRLVWKRQKRKGNLFVKIFRTDFYVGRKVVRKDRKAPFVHTQTVSAGATAGSTVTVRARAFIKVKRGDGPKKSISTTVRVCS